MIGRVGVCVTGRLGIITGRDPVSYLWLGTGLLDGKKWQSTSPCILSYAESERIETLLQTEYRSLCGLEELHGVDKTQNKCECDGMDTSICRLHR